MGRKAVWGGVAFVVLLCLPGAVAAQQSWKQVQIADIESMRDKFIGLAEAFDEAHYEWRPMAGVRSVGEVLGLAVAEANMFPTVWGEEPGPMARGGFGMELQRAGALSKAEMIPELHSSFEHLLRIVEGMDEAARMKNSSYFNQGEMPIHANIATAMADMHEHLGQLIAYARTNEVVPPWSQGG